MKVNVALCDDNKRALPVISGATQSAFQAQGIQANIVLFERGEDLLAAMDETHFHLVMLDIEMPGMDGIEIGKEIRSRKDDTRIVFVSEAENRVFESFYVQPLGFVRKSNFLNDIAAVIELFIKESSKNSNSELIDFITRTGRMALRGQKIILIEGSRNYQILYAEGIKTPVEIKMTMQQLEEMLTPYGFIRIHKGYIVNYQYIHQINNNEIILLNGMSVPIGRSKVADVRMQYLNLIGK